MGFGKDGKGQIIREFITDGALGALAAKDVVAFQGPAIAEDFRILKSEVYAIVNALTTNEANGLLFGIANGELSAAEIEECIEAQGPLNANDRVATERAMRNVKILGMGHAEPEAGTEVTFENEHGGPLLLNKHRWTYHNPQGWDWFIYNIGGSLTTGGLLQLVASHYGLWIT